MENSVQRYIASWLSLNAHYRPVFKALQKTHADLSELVLKQVIEATVGRAELFAFEGCAYCGLFYERQAIISTLTENAEAMPLNFCSLEHLKLYHKRQQT
jgi:hypothetical protein